MKGWLCLFAVGLVLTASPALAQEASLDATQTLGIVATAGVGGRFGDPRCRDGETVVPHPAASFTGPLLERTAAPGALALDTGGLLAPHGVTRFANRDLPGDVITLVRALGYDALALGEGDLSAPRARTLQIAAMLRDSGVPYVATNLRCESGGRALCDAVLDAADTPLLLESEAERVAFLAFLDPTVLHRIAPDRSAGLTLAPLAEALPRSVRVARAAGATLIVAVLDSTSDDAFDLARELPEDGRPDLVLLATEGDDLIFARPASVDPAIVSPAPGGGVEVRVARSEEHRFEMRAVPLLRAGEASAGSIASPVHAFVQAVGAPYCEALGEPLPGGHLARDMDADGIAMVAAQTVRELAGADVAILNVGAVHGSFRAASGVRLSGSDLYVAIEYDEPIVVADVPASWLVELQEALGEHPLLTPGLGSTAEEGDDPSEETLRIRGRAPVPRATYRVATIRFLAMGGDDALPELPEGTHWTTLEYVADDGSTRYRSLRDAVLGALAAPDERDPRDARPSPDDPPEWVIRGQLDADFSGSTVSNDASYSAALLDVESAIAMGLELDVHADARAPLFSWENQFVWRYRTQWAPSSEPDTAGQFIEAADQLQLRTLGSYRGFRASADQVYIPDIYVEAFVESELTRPDARDYHWLLLRPTAGFRFPLLTELDVKVQVGFQSQLLDPAVEVEVGAGGSIVLRPWTAIEAGDRSLTIEGLLDFFAYDLGDQNRWQLRGSLDTSLDLAGPLGITFGGTLYVQQEGTQTISVAITATAGVQLAAVTRAVGP